MLRVIHLATAVAVAMVALATLAEADFCMWCDPVMSQNFLLCVGGKIINDPRFSASAEALDDMQSSMIAASKAMKKSSESTKMNMMNGAMAGELAELIKSQPSVGNLKETTSYLLGIVRDCYVQTSGQPHYSFMKDIGKTVNFMLNDDSPPYDDSESKSAPPQTLASSAVYSAQNIMSPPNDNGQQIPSDSNVFIPNQMYASPQSGIVPDASLPFPQTGLRYPAGFANGKGETAPFSLNYLSGNKNNGPFIRTSLSSQMPSAQTNAASRYDLFQQNNLPNVAPDQNKWSNFVPNIGTPQNNVANVGAGFISPDQPLPQNTAPINNTPSSSAAQNSNARPWTIFGINLPNIGLDQFLAQTNEPVNNAARNYNFDYRRNRQNFIPQPALTQSSSAVTTFTSQDKGNPPYYPQNQLVQNFNSNGRVLGQNGAYPLNNVNNSPDQINADASSDYEYQPDYNYYSYYPGSSDTYEYDSNQPPQPSSQNLNWNYPPLLDVNNYPVPNNVYNPVNIVQSNSKNEPQQKYGDQPTRDIPQNSFSSTLPLVKNVNVQGTDSEGIGFLSDGSQPNNAAAAEPNENGKNPVSQPESGPKLGKWTILPSKAKSGVQESSSDENDDVAKAMRFAETIYVLCSESRKFKSVFSKRISNNKAASYMNKIIRGALQDCGYLENAEEIAKSCSDTVKSLPQKCPFIQYGEALSKSLMDEFYTKGLLGENPEQQAKSITTAFLARLKKKKSPRSEELANKSNIGSMASKSGDSSSDYPTDGRNDRSQSSEYQYYQDYPKATGDMRKENYGDYPYYDLSEQGSGDKNSDNDDSTGKQDSAVIDDYYNEYDNYPNPATDFQYLIKTSQPKAIQTAQKTEKANEKALEGKVLNTGYNYQMYGDYPDSKKNNDQNQKSTGKIPSDNLKYDYYNQNYNYDPNYDYYNQYYGNYDNLNAKPNKQPTKPDYYSDQLQRINSNAKDRMKIENAITESTTVTDYSDTTTEDYIDYSQTTYPDYGITLKKNDVQPEKTELPDSTSNEDSKKSYPETALLSLNDEKAERKNRLNILMKWALSSISDGKFNYKIYSNVISAIAKYLQSTHPEWRSQKCFITILIESLVACTQLLARVPQEYIAKMSVPENTDTADETIENWSTNTLKQEKQDSIQPDQTNPSQDVQTYEEPQKNKGNNDYEIKQTNSPSSVFYNNMAQPGYQNSFVDSNLNIPLTNQGRWVANVPQTGAGVQMPSLFQGYKDLPQQNNWNNKYQLNQGSPLLPRLNMQQGYGNRFQDTNLNMQLPRQETWIRGVPQSGEESLIATSQDTYNGLPQQNNWNYGYQSSQGNSFQPELNNNKQQGYGNRFLDSNFNVQLPVQGG